MDNAKTYEYLHRIMPFMAIVPDRHGGVVFVSVPKAGSQSIHRTFMKKIPHLCNTRGVASVLVWIQKQGQTWDRMNSFAVIRSPFERLGSLWHRWNKKRKFPGSFDEFLRDVQNPPSWDLWKHTAPTTLFTHYEGEQMVKTIIGMDELDSVPERFFGSHKELPWKNVSGRTSHMDMYTDEQASMVMDLYAEDFKLLEEVTGVTV